jgi:hypothetical protein
LIAEVAVIMVLILAQIFSKSIFLSRENKMERIRLIKQIRVCVSDNWCKNGKRTPYSLSSEDSPDENEIEEYCEGCKFLVWQNLE